MRSRHSVDTYTEGVLSGDRVLLGQAITLIESSLDSDQELAAAVLERILPATGKAFRMGITGVPGVGKSTFIDAFGSYLVAQGHTLGVLAVDPSSNLTQGSILGDKTRMERISHHPRVFVRPSPSGGSLGGVARKTRETMLLCEAAGFDMILVETVGVGQSETAVHDMVDFFLLLMLPNAGDELQGIKKGIMEMADGIFINKAEANAMDKARIAQAAYSQALRLFAPPASGWHPQVAMGSALNEVGLHTLYQWMLDFQQKTWQNGYWEINRQEQSIQWLKDTILHRLSHIFFESPAVKAHWEQTQAAVTNKEIPPVKAAQQLLRLWQEGYRQPGIDKPEGQGA